MVTQGIALGIVFMSGPLKLSGKADGVKMLQFVGVGDYRIYLGVVEIIFAALFTYPKIMTFGFILLVCYFGGALATELPHSVSLNALAPIVLTSLVAVLHDRYIILPFQINQ